MAFEEINPGQWKPENEGDFIEGILLKSEKEVGENKSMLYHLESEDGLKAVWGSVVLDQRMAFINIGSKIRITFKGLGEKVGGKNAPKLFKVEIDKE